jgi:mercuric ion binding protein
MLKIIRYAALAFGLAISSSAFAGEKTVTLAVKNMYCADCPFIVKRSLEGVSGVTKAVVSLKDKTAAVTFDDTKTDVGALTNATTKAGYPSAQRVDGENGFAIHHYLPELR